VDVLVPRSLLSLPSLSLKKNWKISRIRSCSVRATADNEWQSLQISCKVQQCIHTVINRLTATTVKRETDVERGRQIVNSY